MWRSRKNFATSCSPYPPIIQPWRIWTVFRTLTLSCGKRYASIRPYQTSLAFRRRMMLFHSKSRLWTDMALRAMKSGILFPIETFAQNWPEANTASTKESKFSYQLRLWTLPNPFGVKTPWSLSMFIYQLLTYLVHWLHFWQTGTLEMSSGNCYRYSRLVGQHADLFRRSSCMHRLSFLAGRVGSPRLCLDAIELTASLHRMKALLFVLIRAFEFELAVPASDITRTVMIVQRPKLLSDPKAGDQLPLLIKSYSG